MTGKELIIFILRNDLENEVVLEGGDFVGFMSKEKAAAKFQVGVSTIEMWHNLGMIKGIMIDGSLYIPRNAIVGPVAK
jgi:hypothetical protein